MKRIRLARLSAAHSSGQKLSRVVALLVMFVSDGSTCDLWASVKVLV